MKQLSGWLAAALGIGSLLFQGWVVVGHSDVLEQAMALDFPLTSLGEGLVVMLAPMAATVLATILGLISRRLRAGRVGLVAGVLGGVTLWLIVGTEGFRFLF